MAARVLIVDDEPAISQALQVGLARHGLEVSVAATGQAALDTLRRAPPDVVVLDLGLPDLDGLDVIRAVRARGATPVIVLSAHAEDWEKVQALTRGADDYVTKPFSMDELAARVQVALRHAAGRSSAREAIFRAGALEVDLGHRRVLVGGEAVHLTPIEYELLKALIQQADRVVTNQALRRIAWRDETEGQANYLHVYVARLRKKVFSPCANGPHLLSVPGVGYRLAVSGETSLQ